MGISLGVWAEGLSELMHPSVILFLFAGVIIGTFIGALPGLSATMGIAILTPLTFNFDPTNGFAMLMGLWNAAIFSGGITAILINTPGTPASITQAMDGYALYREGKGGLALGVNVIFSFLGGIISCAALILLAQPIANFTVTFNAAEYFMLALFGLSMMVSVSGGDVLKGLILGVLGILVSTIGLDPILAVKRFTFGNTNMLGGISFIPVMIGMFGIGEVMYQMFTRNREQEEKEMESRKVNLALGKVLPSRKEMAHLTPRCAIVACAATVIGAIPAAGGDISAIICWGNSQKFSKEGDKYGHGSIEGLAVSSAANNGVIGGAMTTMMTLGIPGDSVTAILIGSLTMYGMQPGIKMFTENAKFTTQIMSLMVLANIAFLIVGLATAKVSARVLNVAQPSVWAAVTVLCVLGSYALNNSYFDVWVMFGAAICGFFFKLFDFPTGPLVLGLLLGSMLESNLRRALVMSGGSYLTFITRPVSCVLLILVIVAFCWPLIRNAWRNRGKKKDNSENNQ